jgi:hypothetical protein
MQGNNVNSQHGWSEAAPYGYMINVASALNGVGYGAWSHIDGWSEAVVEYIRELESAP